MPHDQDDQNNETLARYFGEDFASADVITEVIDQAENFASRRLNRALGQRIIRRLGQIREKKSKR